MKAQQSSESSPIFKSLMKYDLMLTLYTCNCVFTIDKVLPQVLSPLIFTANLCLALVSLI